MTAALEKQLDVQLAAKLAAASKKQHEEQQVSLQSPKSACQSCLALQSQHSIHSSHVRGWMPVGVSCSVCA